MISVCSVFAPPVTHNTFYEVTQKAVQYSCHSVILVVTAARIIASTDILMARSVMIIGLG